MVSTRINGILKPSLRGSKNQPQPASQTPDSSVCDVRAVQELQDSESAITCIVFGQERLHLGFILLAAAAKDGVVVVYRLPRSAMEQQMFEQTSEAQLAIAGRSTSNVSEDYTNMAVHVRCEGHTRAIVCMFFNPMEDILVTTSIDKQVRCWKMDTGEVVKVFTDSSPVPCALFMPFDPRNLVIANSNAVLRIINIQNGCVLQKLKVESEVRALNFDESGLFLFAGTKNGAIHVLESTHNAHPNNSSSLKFNFKFQLARGGITNIVFVPEQGGNLPTLLVNSSDSHVSIVDVIYDGKFLKELSVRYRVKVSHSLLPLKCCFSPGPDSDHGGFLISPAEDKKLYIVDLSKGGRFDTQNLQRHQSPIVAVARSLQNTVLASADTMGRIILWRRIDFSAIKDQNATSAMTHEAVIN
eukprot:gene1022-573_t